MTFLPPLRRALPPLLLVLPIALGACIPPLPAMTDPSPVTAEAPVTSQPPPRFSVCMRPEATGDVRADTMRALLGASAHGDEAARWRTQLGDARREDEDGERRERFDGAGVEWRTDPDDEARVREVWLVADRHRAWNGVLPEGLTFSMDVRAVFDRLGPPDERVLRPVAWLPHHYRARGVAVRFDERGCLMAVTLLPPEPEGTVRFDTTSSAIDTRAREGATGFTVAAVRTPGDVGPQRAFRLALTLYDEHGAAVRLRDADGRASARTETVLDDAGYERLTRRIFVPWSALVLAAGPHRLRGAWAARRPDGRALAVTGETDFTVDVTMPPLFEVGVSIASAEAAHRPWDDVDTHFSAPDLRWTRERDRGDGTSARPWRSAVREDVFLTTWRGMAPGIVVARDDLFSVCVEDADVLLAETVGCVRVTLARLVELGRTRQRVSAGELLSLRFAPPTVRPVR